MLFESKKILRKIDGGAVLMQTLLGLAIMIAMTPLILGQIRKYNESIHREEVVAQLKLLQKAVTSYITFDRTKIIEGCTLYDINDIKNTLKDYGGDRIVSPNQFGQNYYFVTCKEVFQRANAETKQEEDSRIDAAVFASGGGVDDITLNSIGEYLFDQGAVLSTNTHDLLANYEVKLNEKLKKMITDKIGDEGALLMFVSDAFQVSDYLYRATGPGGSTIVNTMLTNINMLGHNLVNVYNAKGTLLETNQLKVAGLAGKKLTLADTYFDTNTMFSIENSSPFDMLGGDNEIKIYAKDINLTSLQVDDATFLKVDLPIGELKTNTLETENLDVEGNVNIVPKNNVWQFGAKEVNADVLNSKGTKANVFKNVTLKEKTVSDENYQSSYIYWGKVGSDGKFDDYDSGILSLDGVSEVSDICWRGGSVGGGSSCLSERVNIIYKKILDEWKYYNSIFSE